MTSAWTRRCSISSRMPSASPASSADTPATFDLVDQLRQRVKFVDEADRTGHRVDDRRSGHLLRNRLLRLHIHAAPSVGLGGT